MNDSVQPLYNVKKLRSLPEGSHEPFESILMLKKCNVRTARNGSEFLIVELGDKEGSFSTTCFSDSPFFNTFKSFPEGTILKVSGLSEHYQGRFNPKIESILQIEEDDLAHESYLSQLVETSTESAENLWQELHTFIHSISHPILKQTVENAIHEVEETLKNIPAAISMHHAYRHGLLEHTVHVARAGAALLPLYPEINPDLAIAGILLHDIGKTLEYQANGVTKKTTLGALQGHVVLGYRIVRKAAMKAKLDSSLLDNLEHIILSHQGELEWGAAVMASTPEAVFVSMVDNLDAKMGMVQNALRKSNENDIFSDYIPGLKSNLLIKNDN